MRSSPVFAKQDPEYYAGAQLHRIKQEKVQKALERSGLDALLFFKAEAVRYITDFYVKGFRPFMEPEYVVLVAKGHAPAVGYTSGSDDLRIRFKSDIADARKLPALPGWAEAIAGLLSDYGLGAGAIGSFAYHRDLQPAVRGVDVHLWLRAAHRRAVRPAHAPRPHPGIERRRLGSNSPRTAAGKAEIPPEMNRRGPKPSIPTSATHHLDIQQRPPLQSASIATGLLLLRRAGRKLLRR